MSHEIAYSPDGATSDATLGDMPVWDLSDLYKSPDDPKIESDLEWLRSACASFATDFAGKLEDADATQLLSSIERYEEIQTLSGRIMSFAGLRYYQMTTDPSRSKFLSDMQSAVTDTSAKLVFFSLELNRISDDHLDDLTKSSAGLRRYKPVLDNIRAFRPHQLSDELESFLHAKSVVGASAWNKLFDEKIAELEFDCDGDILNLETTLTKFTDTDRNVRETSFHALSAVFADNLPLFSRITNTLIKDKAIEDEWRKMPTPQYGRHLSNQVEPEVVDALRDAVVAAYPRLSHRYYALKAKWMGLETLEVWDRNAPIATDPQDAIDWAEARNIVSGAYKQFAPEMAEIADDFFEKGWIDAGTKPGKAPGAFAHPTVSDVHPYVMLNYLGKQRDVMTLAHELGHGVHQVLAAKQGELLSSTPLTLAETASVFGEMLTFQKLLGQAKNPSERKVLLAGKVEDMINTVVRQIAFYDFECKLHDARGAGELMPQDINDIWMSVQRESLGPVFNFTEGYETFWCYVPHFVHSPFYVYSYAFGDGLVNALYAVYQQGDESFVGKYFDMLSAGGSKHHSELLAPFGLDASDPNFWAQGLELISSMIDELETL